MMRTSEAFPSDRRDKKGIDAGGRIDDQELAKGGTLDLGGQALHPFPGEEILRATIGEASNHASQY